MTAMYDSINNEHSDSISGDLDRVSDVVDSNYDVNDYDKDENVMPYDKDKYVMPNEKEKNEMPYDSDNQYMTDDNDDDKMPTKDDNDSETVTDKMKHVDNKNSYDQTDVGKKDMVTLNKMN